MDKKLLLVLLGISLLVIGSISYVALTPKQSEVSLKPTAPNQMTEREVEAPVSPVSKVGTYTTYSEDAALTTSGTKLLFFHAPWCPQCRDIETSINEGGIPNDVTVFKVDYDSNQALRQQYGVTLQTTFVKIDDQGNKIASYVAYEEPQFSSVERELLK